VTGGSQHDAGQVDTVCVCVCAHAVCTSPRQARGRTYDGNEDTQREERPHQTQSPSRVPVCAGEPDGLLREARQAEREPS
jgi:hypothetical protein